MTDKFPIPSLFLAFVKPFAELDIVVHAIILDATSITYMVGGLFAKVDYRHLLFEVSMGVSRLDCPTHNQVCETEFEVYTIVTTWLKEQQ